VKGELPRQLATYAAVGAIGTALDFGLLWALLHVRVWTPLAVTVAYTLATALQFFLNRHWSFRAFDRPAVVQAPAYAAVTVVNWLVALLFVEAGTTAFHLAPLAAKALSIPPSALVGFVGTRHVAFGPGLGALYRGVRSRLRAR
jgi:putative flippase GtrA